MLIINIFARSDEMVIQRKSGTSCVDVLAISELFGLVCSTTKVDDVAGQVPVAAAILMFHGMRWTGDAAEQGEFLFGNRAWK